MPHATFDHGELLERLEDFTEAGFAETTTACAEFLRGNWAAAFQHATDARAILRERAGVSWELATAQFFGLGAQFFLGDLRGIATSVGQAVRAAERRGNLLAATSLRTWFTNSAWLISDEPDRAQHEAGAPIRTVRRDRGTGTDQLGFPCVVIC